MKNLLLPISCCLAIAACSTGGRVKPDGTIEGPTSFLGEQVVAEYEAHANGRSLKIKAYATHNPDRQLTKTVGSAVNMGLTIGGANHISDNQPGSPKSITASANGVAKVKGTTDPQAVPGKALGDALIKGTADPNVIPK